MQRDLCKARGGAFLEKEYGSVVGSRYLACMYSVQCILYLVLTTDMYFVCTLYVHSICCYLLRILPNYV